MGADCVGFPLPASAGVGFYRLPACSAFVVNFRVCECRRKADTVTLYTSLSGAAHGTGHYQKRTLWVIVCAWLPFLCKKSLSLKVAVELIG